MLTPKFEIDQTSTTVIITVFAPFARVPDVEVSIVDNIFIFYCSPYYLRLTLPGNLIDSEHEKHSAKFDADKKSFAITCIKVTPGEDFAGLDMLTKLLTPQGDRSIKKPLIDDISGDADSEESTDDTENEWLIEQSLTDDQPLLPNVQKYGFAGNSSSVFNKLAKELHELIDLKDPDNKTPSQRQEERILQEKAQFSEDHYLADLYEDELAVDAIQYIPEYYTITSDEVCLSEEDNNAMMKLPRKKYLLDRGNQTTGVFLGLVDLIFCWCYNHRITKGENCSESAWNIKKLSPTLSWLNMFTDLRSLLIANFRRTLCYPLIRNWSLSQQVLKDTQKILSLGQKQVLKCLLDIQKVLNSEEPFYILNELYVTDYCAWIQEVNDGKLLRLSDDVKQIKLSKSDVDLELDELEAAAEMVLKEQELDNSSSVNGLSENLQSLSIIENSMAKTFNDNTPTFCLPTGYEKQLPAVSDEDSDDSSSSSDSDSDSNDDEDDDDGSSTNTSSESSDESENSSSDLDSDDDSDA